MPALRGARGRSLRSRRANGRASRNPRSAVRRTGLRVLRQHHGSAGWNSSSCNFSPGRSPMNSIPMSRSGAQPARRII